MVLSFKDPFGAGDEEEFQLFGHSRRYDMGLGGDADEKINTINIGMGALDRGILSTTFVANTIGIEFPDDAQRFVNTAIFIPKDYVEGTKITIRLFWMVEAAGAVVAAWDIELFGGGLGEADTVHNVVSGTNLHGTSLGNNVFNITEWTPDKTNWKIDDTVQINLSRIGDAGADTVNASAWLFGLIIEYQSLK